MKTTINIPDSLFRELKNLSTSQSVTMKEIIVQALRDLLSSKKSRSTPFKLRDAAVDGSGLQSGISGHDWSSIREKIYEGRGG